MTNIDLVNSIFTILKAGGIIMPIIQFSKADNDVKAEYYAINCLANQWLNPIEVVQVNINCHVKDLANSIPDLTKLNTNTQAIKNILNEYSNGTIEAYLVFEAGPIKEQQLNEHYMNLRFDVSIT